MSRSHEESLIPHHHLLVTLGYISDPKHPLELTVLRAQMSYTHVLLITPVVLLNADLSKWSADFDCFTSALSLSQTPLVFLPATAPSGQVPVNTFAVVLPTAFLLPPGKLQW